MTWQELFTLGVIAAIVFVLTRDLLPPAAAMVGGMVAVMVAGIVTPEQALAGFANPAPITIAALYVVAKAMENTGALTPIFSRMLGESSSERVTLTRLLVPIAAISGFVNNTPMVAMLIPQVEAWSRLRGRSSSSVLMPVSYAAILGGVIAVTGTATTIAVSGLLVAAGYEAFGFFELAWVGIPIAILGTAVLVLTAPIFLPARRSVREQTVEEFREFVIDMLVLDAGPVAGRSVEDAGLRHLEGVFLVQIERNGEVIAPVAPQTRLHGGDLLRFVGKADVVVDLQAKRGLETTEQAHTAQITAGQSSFFEVVIGADSPLIGSTIRETEFRGRYQAAVVAVHRAGQRVDAKIGDVRLRVGDTLLVLADPGFKARWSDRRDFLLVSPLSPGASRTSPKAWYVAAAGLGIVVFAAAGILPLVSAALLGATALVLVGAIGRGDARSAVDLDVLITIAAAFSMSAALTESGLADRIADFVVDGFGGLGPVAVLTAVIVLTFVMTEIITAKASVLLVFPIALSAAAAVGADARPFAVAVASVGAYGFLSPIGYPTNTMVYGPGGYRMGDYLRMGLPQTLIVLSCVAVIVPIHWAL